MTKHRHDRSPRRSQRFLHTLRGSLTGAILLGMLGMAGCTSAPPTKDASDPAITLPDTAVGKQATWVLDVINAEDPVAEAEVAQHLAESMFEQLSVRDFTDVFEQLRADKPWIVTKYDGSNEHAVLGIAGATGPVLEMTISLDDDGLINGLFFALPQPDRTPAADWEQLEKTARALPASTSLSVTRVTDQLHTILAVDADAVKPIGSIFKLYVLAAVVSAVEDGSLSWDTELTVTDDLRSLPSGKLQERPTGTVVTVREAADLMISISDNTATDMLINAVGRDAVEKAQVLLGHHDPMVNTPFLTTREMFQLGWGEPDAARERWAAANVAERRTVLAELPKGLLNITPAAVAAPVWQFGLDWFANSEDLRAAHLGLQNLALTEAGEPVRDILSMNPGAGMSIGDEWTYVAFKGGSSQGELAGSWYVERADGERFTLSIQASSENPADLADIRAYFGLIEDALALLAKE